MKKMDRNLYKKTLGVLGFWLIAMMLFVVTPSTAQVVTGISITEAAPYYPNDKVTVTATVTDLVPTASYRYYVVYDYDTYGEFKRFTHQTAASHADVTLTLDVDGNGTIEIQNVTIPTDLYRYDSRRLSLLIVNGTTLETTTDPPAGWTPSYPLAGYHYLGDRSFQNYNFTERAFTSPTYYQFDDQTAFTFRVNRINTEPATKSNVFIQYKKGAGAWTTIDTVKLNSQSGTHFVCAKYDPSVGPGQKWVELPDAIQGSDIAVRLIQKDGQTLASYIDTWEVEDLELYNVVGETPGASDYTAIFTGLYYVKNLVTPFYGGFWFNITAPSFAITDFNIDAVDLYPGATVKYEITGGTSMDFPANTVFEVYLRNIGTGEEMFLNTITAANMPAEGIAKEFNFKLPFRPAANWRLYVRADVRDQVITANTASFTILGVNLTATFDIEDTPLAQRFEYDGVQYLYPGSTVKVEYALAGGQTITTPGVQVNLEYSPDGFSWYHLNSAAYSGNPGASISGNLPSNDQLINVPSVQFRVYLSYGNTIELRTTHILRPESIGFSNTNQLPTTYNLGWANYKAGSKFSFHTYVKNSVAQNLIVERRIDGGTWVQVGTIATGATEKRHSSHYATTFYDIVPTGMDEITGTPEFRIRWADGAPAGENMGLHKGRRVQRPHNNNLNIYATAGAANVFYPYLTLSDNIEKYYEFDVDADGNGIGNVDIDVYYNQVGFATGGTTKISAVLVNKGDNPEAGDPYIYLGSKNVGAQGQDNFTTSLSYAAAVSLYGQELPLGLVDDNKAQKRLNVTALSHYEIGETVTVQFKMSIINPYWYRQLYLVFPEGVIVSNASAIGVNPGATYGNNEVYWGTSWSNHPTDVLFTLDITVDADFDKYFTIQSIAEVWTGSMPIFEYNTFSIASEVFDIYLYATDKTTAEPIQFMTYQSTVGFNGLDMFGLYQPYDAKPMMITDAIDFTSMQEPRYVTYSWWDNGNISPLNSSTTPVLEYTTNEGATWTQIETYPFNTTITVDGAMISSQTRFRWKQNIEVGDWDVWNVRVFTGESNLVNFGYQAVNMPTQITMARKNVAVPVIPPVNYCADFNDASLEGYEFATDVEMAYAGHDFDFEWTFMAPDDNKAITNQALSVSGNTPYKFGENDMTFILAFESTKAITQFTMAFPAGVTPTAADQMWTNGNTLTPVIAGQTITWSAAAGVVMNSQFLLFNVTFDVDDTYSEEIAINWTLTDADGTQSDVLEILPYTPFPDGTVFNFYLNSVAPANLIAGNITETGTITASIPGTFNTNTYQVWATASYVTLDANDNVVNCGTKTFMVYDELLVIADTTEEAYHILVHSFAALNDDDTDPNFYFGGEMNIVYETFGPYSSNERFAVLLYDMTTGNYVSIGTQNQTGVISQDVEIPTSQVLLDNGFDLVTNNLYVFVAAYTGTASDDVVLWSDLINMSQFTALNNGNGTPSLTFNGFQENNGVYTKRYAISKSLAHYLGTGATLDNHKLQFTFTQLGAINPLNVETAPRIEVSIDGGQTYTTNLGIVYQNGNYSIDITQAWLDNANNVYFRWIQDYPAGAWQLSNIRFVIGESNWFEEVFSILYSINIIEVPTTLFNCNNYNASLGAYNWNLVDATLDPAFDPVVRIGTDFDFEWKYDDTNINPEFPDNTEFTFYLVANIDGQTVLDPTTGDRLEFGPYTTTAGLLEATESMPAYVLTGMYQVRALAYYAYVEEGVDKDCDNWSNVLVQNILVVNDVQIDYRQLSLVDPTWGDNFLTEEEFDLTYSTFGEWPADIKFAAVLKADIDNNGNYQYVVLDESTDKGFEQVISDLEMIPAPWLFEDGTQINTYELGIVAYQGANLVLPNVNETIEEEDFVHTEGYQMSGIWMLFDQEGNRKAVTNVLDLSGLNAVNLQFNYWSNNITVSANSLPKLMVTIDGGVTYQALEVPGAAFGELGLLDANTFTTYSVPVPAMYATSTTQFMWVQPSNGGANDDEWAITNIVITAGASNVYEGYADWININLNWPNLGNYAWSIVEDAYGLEPTIYNGSTFEYEWELGVDGNGDPLPSFATGTEIKFVLWDLGPDAAVIDPATGLEIVLGTVDTEGVFNATIPFLVDRDFYGVKAFATYGGVELDAAIVSGFFVFNEVIRTIYVESNPVLFSGNQATFKAELENTIDPSVYNNIWFNLVMNFDGKNWLLAAQQGITNNFVVDIPPYVNGNRTFTIMASEGSAMGIVGQPIQAAAGVVLANADFNDFFYPGTFTVTGATGSMGQLYTNKLDIEDMQTLKFQIKISELIDNLTADQKLVLAYSVNGGITYTDIHTYPDARFTDPLYFDNEDVNDWFNEELLVPAGAQTEETILRWRIEESKGTAQVRAIELVPFNVAYNNVPLREIGQQVAITPQRIDITATNALEYCNDGTVVLSYNIRGKFGADNEMTLLSTAGALQIDGENVVFTGITGGSGTVTLNLDQLDNVIAGNNIFFRLRADDKTNDDYNFTRMGNWSELGVAIINEIPTNTGVFAQTIWNNEHISCAQEERIVVINNIIPNFTYQLKNHLTGANIGTAVLIDLDNDDLLDNSTYPYYNPFTGRLEVSIGTVAQRLVVEVLVTALNAAGDLVCEIMVPNSQAAFDIRPVYALHVDKLDNSGNFTGVYEPVTNGQQFIVCEGTNTLRFRMGYWKDGNFNTTAVDWFRNNQTMPLGTFTTLSNFTVGGNYYATYDDGDCGQYQSVSFSVVVNQAPEQPVITVVGNPVVCEGETVTLNATAGYAYYKWYRNGLVTGNNTATHIATESGAYRVEVSNVPFALSCESVWSTPVYVEVFEFTPIAFVSDVTLCPTGDGIAEITVNGAQSEVTYNLINDATGAVFGPAFSGHTGTLTFETAPITATTVFTVYAQHNEISGCNEMVHANLLTVTIDKPVFSAFEINGDGVYEIIANAATYQACSQDIELYLVKDNQRYWGGAADRVVWYKDGNVFAQTWTIMPTESGVYRAKYVNNITQDDCEYFTEAITLTISAKPVRPAITYQGQLEFCEGEGDLVLSAPAGFAAYRWFRNGAPVAGVSLGSNQMHVVMTGDYTVVVENANGCQSEPSLALEANVHAKPVMPLYTVVDDVLCEPGVVNVIVNNAEANVLYQIYNVLTGTASGVAKMGTPNLVLTSANIAQDAIFEIRATRVDVNACASVSVPFEVTAYELEVTASANTLIASIGPNQGAVSYQWYRNGNIIVTGGNGQTLNIYDNAEYTVVVVTAEGCELKSTVNKKGFANNADVNKNNLIVFPNPATDYITLSYNSDLEESLTISIVNYSGSVVFSVLVDKTETNIEHQIPVSELSAGIYQIHVVGAENVKVQKFVKL